MTENNKESTSFWCAILACFVLFVLLALSGYSIFKERKEHTSTRMSLNAIAKEESTISYMSEALQVEYEISPIEADCYARIYRKWARSSVKEWTIFAAITRIESRFDPTLTSSAGAGGLMQLMRPTRDWLCASRGIVSNNTTAWRDVLNLDLGCELVTKYMKEYGDTLGIALYNVGPANRDTFKVSQKAFTDSVFKYSHKLAIIYRGIQ